MGNVNQIVLVPFEAVFGPPDSPNSDLFFDLYEEVLEHYSDSILERAAKRVIAEHPYASWPKPADVKRACDALLEAPKRPEHEPLRREDIEPPNAMARARVDRMVKQAMEALQNGRTEDQPGRMPGEGVSLKKLQRASPNFHLHMTPKGQREFLETGRKPDHPKPDLMKTDAIREAEANSDAMGLTELSKRMSGDRE